MSSNPREAKSRNESSKSAGDLVCTSAVSAPSLLLINCSPLKAAAFQPASLTGPGVSNATRNLEEAAGARGEVQAPSKPIARIANTMGKKVHCRQAESFGQRVYKVASPEFFT